MQSDRLLIRTTDFPILRLAATLSQGGENRSGFFL
jgi:hypothetical protein